MTGLDILVLLLVGGGLVRGFMRGFATELLSLASWIAAIVALKLLHGPVAAALVAPVGTYAGAAVLAFALVFGITFFGGKFLAHRIGGAARKSVVGPVDRILGAGFGALKGLIGATILYLAANLAYDTLYGRAAERPGWMATSRSYPLLHGTGRAIVDFVEWRRRAPAPAEAGTDTEADPA